MLLCLTGKATLIIFILKLNLSIMDSYDIL